MKKQLNPYQRLVNSILDYFYKVRQCNNDTINDIYWLNLNEKTIARIEFCRQRLNRYPVIEYDEKENKYYIVFKKKYPDMPYELWDKKQY